METLQRLADKREQAAARAMADALRQLQEQRGRMEGLSGFRQEYAQRLIENGRQGMGVNRLRDHQRFLERLDEAQLQQVEAIRRAEEACTQQRQLWMLARRNSATYDRLAEQYRQAARHEAERREQRETDEHATRHHAND